MTASQGTPVWMDLLTPDLETTKRFYTGLFGWEIPDGDPQLGHYARATLQGRDVVGICPTDVIGEGEQQQASPQWTTYLSVVDITETIDKTATYGGNILADAMAVGGLGEMAVLSDPSGAAIGVWEAGSFAGAVYDGTPGLPCWFECVSREFDASKRFYGEVFGLQMSAADPGGEGRFSMATPAGARREAFGVFGFPEGVPDNVPSYWMPYFGVPDCDAATKRAVELGAAVLLDPADIPLGRWSNVQAPTGEQFGLFQFRN